jgi:hypothetical protein
VTTSASTRVGQVPATAGAWPATRRYLAVAAIGHLAWEFAQMPLYTLWRTGSPAEIAFAGLHCTGGDVLIATLSLAAARLIAGQGRWPGQRFLAVAALTVGIGLAYTLFSEWLNVEVRQAWAYRDIMPTLPWLGTGLAPVAQWLVVPSLAFRVARPGPTAHLPPERCSTQGDAR